MSKKVKLEIKEEQQEVEEQLRCERIDTSDVITKPEIKDENELMEIRMENPDESAELGDSVLYCIGGKLSHFDTESDKDKNKPPMGWDPQPTISHLSGSLTTPQWKTIDWPHPRLRPATVIHDHKLFILGGTEASSTLLEKRTDHRLTYLDTIEVFDLRQKRWFPIRRLPVGMAYMFACSLGGYIYICGGLYKKGDAREAEPVGLLRYHPNSGRLEKKQKPTSFILREHKDALVAVNGYLYALSGGDFKTNHLSIERYDPIADQWTFLQPNRKNYEPVQKYSAAAHRGKIYLLSDKYGLEVYCPVAGSWSRLAHTPDHEKEQEMVGALASINGRLVSVGNLGCKPNSKIYEFDFETAVWIRRMDANFLRRNFHLQIYDLGRQ